MTLNETFLATRTHATWQEETARVLLRSGFRPSSTIGHVEHTANTHDAGRTERTFGSVWQAMRSLVESAPSASQAHELDGSEPAQ